MCGEEGVCGGAVNAWWCIKYCEEGEPYGLSVEGMQSMIRESQAILRKCKKHFESSRLSKTTFVYGCICRRLLWLYKNRYAMRRISEATRKKFDAGHVIGELAQRLFPDGVDASAIDADRVIDMTRVSLPFNIRQQLWLQQTDAWFRTRTVYEAAFVYDDVFAAVDILVNADGRHIAYEVKSHRSVTDTILRDCALQYYVISRSCRLDDFFIVYVDENYLDELGLTVEEVTDENVDIERLFVVESVMSRILPMQDEIRAKVRECKDVLAHGEPAVEPGEQCSTPYECMFAHYCRRGADYSDGYY
ncbi:MAG: hypothetical protein K2I48_06310 [Muribaculaceae bacterium]|nr:hypothetical protein [Muribaculaceae bacterium]